MVEKLTVKSDSPNLWSDQIAILAMCLYLAISVQNVKYEGSTNGFNYLKVLLLRPAAYCGFGGQHFADTYFSMSFEWIVALVH